MMLQAFDREYVKASFEMQALRSTIAMMTLPATLGTPIRPFHERLASELAALKKNALRHCQGVGWLSRCTWCSI